MLLAWLPNGQATSDSGVKVAATLEKCDEKSIAFSYKNKTLHEHCKPIYKKNYEILARQEATFLRELNQTGAKATIQEEDQNEEVKKYKAALKAIGRMHVGKTRDSQRVRKIIKDVTNGK